MAFESPKATKKSVCTPLGNVHFQFVQPVKQNFGAKPLAISNFPYHFPFCLPSEKQTEKSEKHFPLITSFQKGCGRPLRGNQCNVESCDLSRKKHPSHNNPKKQEDERAFKPAGVHLSSARYPHGYWFTHNPNSSSSSRSSGSCSRRSICKPKACASRFILCDDASNPSSSICVP